RGDFFGEIAALTGGPPTADVVAITLLRCLTVPGPELEAFLLDHPRVMFRMLQAEARRLGTANLWLRQSGLFPPGRMTASALGGVRAACRAPTAWAGSRSRATPSSRETTHRAGCSGGFPSSSG